LVSDSWGENIKCRNAVPAANSFGVYYEKDGTDNRPQGLSELYMSIVPIHSIEQSQLLLSGRTQETVVLKKSWHIWDQQHTSDDTGDHFDIANWIGNKKPDILATGFI
jgi:hypothetical protein